MELQLAQTGNLKRSAWLVLMLGSHRRARSLCYCIGCCSPSKANDKYNNKLVSKVATGSVEEIVLSGETDPGFIVCCINLQNQPFDLPSYL